MRRAASSTLIAAALALCVGAGAARAQIDTKSNAPIDITANQATVINSKCVTIWSGAAEVLQGDTRLRADTITAYEAVKGGEPTKGTATDTQQNCGNVQKVVADGNVYYVTPTQHAHGDHAVYTEADDEIVLTGGVIVVQGKNVARGDKLIIKVSTKQFTMVSRSTGAGQPDRVRGVFYPDKTNQPATPATPAGPGAQ